MDSTSKRTHYNVLTRPHKFVGGQSPLSDNSPYLADDPITAKLFEKKDKEKQQYEEARRIQVINRKADRMREMSRRICERETVENYVQTPYLVSKGGEMTCGINVYDGESERELCIFFPH
jgi:hypothetical protein